MKNKSMLVIVLMGSILSFLPQVLWAGDATKRMGRAMKAYHERMAQLDRLAPRFDLRDASAPSISPVPIVPIRDVELSCNGQALVDYERCVDRQEERCGEELERTLGPITMTPYFFVCPSNEEITDLPCREERNETFESCTCRREADERYEDCLQSPESSASCENARFGDYLRCPASSRQLLDTQVQ